jgi:hypothetical protein
LNEVKSGTSFRAGQPFPAFAALNPGYGPDVVTTGLDPAVHAGDPRANLFRVNFLCSAWPSVAPQIE